MSAPKTAKKIKKEIDGLISALIESGICDDSNFCSIKGGVKHCEISFQGAEHISLAYDDIDYEEIYRELENKRSFNMKLIDGALIQMLFRLHHGKLTQHRLAFYPSPSLRPFQDDPDSYIRDELYVDITSRRITPFPLRFDFDSRDGVYKDVEHPKSHLTLGDVESCRIPVSTPVSPRWFLDFIIRSFYQNDIYNFTDKLPKHELSFPSCISKRETSLVHITIPVI